MKIYFYSIILIVFTLFSCTKQTIGTSPTSPVSPVSPIQITEKVDILTSIANYNQYDTIVISGAISSVTLKTTNSKIIERGIYVSLNSDLNSNKLDSIKNISEGLTGTYNFTFGKVQSNTIYYITSYCLSSNGTKFLGNTLKFTSNDFTKNLSNGLVIYFPFDNDIVDKIGTIKSCLGFQYSFIKGQVGNGLFLKGNSNSYLEFADYYAMPKTYTISAWVNAGEDASEPKVVQKPFFSKDLSFSYYATYSTALNPSSYPAFYGSDLKIWDFYGMEPFTRNQPVMNHYVYVNDGKTLLEYKNGVLYGTYNLTLFTLNENSNKIKIGKSGNFSDKTFGEVSYPYGYFNGVLDELKVFNRALSPTEISILYQMNK
jgi:hypothetical protein